MHRHRRGERAAGSARASLPGGDGAPGPAGPGAPEPGAGRARPRKPGTSPRSPVTLGRRPRDPASSATRTRRHPQLPGPGFPEGRLPERGPRARVPARRLPQEERPPRPGCSPPALLRESGRGFMLIPPPGRYPPIEARSAATRARPPAISALIGGRGVPLARCTPPTELQRAALRKLRPARGPGRPGLLTVGLHRAGTAQARVSSVLDAVSLLALLRVPFDPHSQGTVLHSKEPIRDAGSARDCAQSRSTYLTGYTFQVGRPGCTRRMLCSSHERTHRAPASHRAPELPRPPTSPPAGTRCTG